jgi:cell wall-associated NlpC family hydrolase
MRKIDDLETYVGTSYIDRGRSKEEGFDCWGLILELTKRVHDFDLPDPEYKLDSVEDAAKLFSAYDMYKWVDNVEIENIQYGDLVTLRSFALAKMPYHIGMYIGNRKVIHMMRCGTVIQRLEILKPYIIGVYRPKND